MASTEAVQRRRDSRASRKAGAQDRQREREKREREIAVRVAKRFWGDGPVYVIVLSYAYWQARRCGWDALSAEVRGRDIHGKIMHPSESAFWAWWTKGLHPAQRGQLVKLSGLKVLR